MTPEELQLWTPGLFEVCTAYISTHTSIIHIHVYCEYINAPTHQLRTSFSNMGSSFCRKYAYSHLKTGRYILWSKIDTHVSTQYICSHTRTCTCMSNGQAAGAICVVSQRFLAFWKFLKLWTAQFFNPFNPIIIYIWNSYRDDITHMEMIII